MKAALLKLLDWLDQVASDPAVGDFAFRVAHAIAQNSRLTVAMHADMRLGVKDGIGSFLTVGQPCISYSALMDQCRASKGGVRKAIKTLEAGGHVAITPAVSRLRPAEYILVLLPRNRAKPHEGSDESEVRRLHDSYELISSMAAKPGTRYRRFRLKGVTDVIPSEYHGRDTMSATRRAAWREARLRERMQRKQGTPVSET